MPTFDLRTGDTLKLHGAMPSQSVHCVVTSPPYFGLRDYGVAEQVGLEATPEIYVQRLVEIFREVKRVLRDDGTLWLNLGDSYANTPVGSFNGGGFKDTSAQTGGRDMSGVATSGRMNKWKASGLKQKDLIGIPWMVAFALRADGWYLRSDIIWAKRNCMPESVVDRPTKAHEYIFLLSKSPKYFYDHKSIKEKQTDSSVDRARYGWAGRTDDNSNGARTGSSFRRMAESGESMTTIPLDGMRNKRSVWHIATEPFTNAHFATFPPKLIEPCIKAGCPEGGTVLDPFAGAGTTGLVALRLGRNFIGHELNPEYVEMARRRIKSDAPMFFEESVA